MLAVAKDYEVSANYLWRLFPADGRAESATRARTADSCAVVWDLDEDLQDAAQLPNREAAVARAEEARRQTLTAPISGWPGPFGSGL